MIGIMKRILLLCLILAISLLAVETDTTGFSFSGSIGLDFIRGLMEGDTTTIWFNIAFTPELSLGYFGVGLYIPLRISTSGELRGEDWDSPGDWISIIRYLRYGKRGTPLWVKAGVLERVTIGYGFIMDNYSNTIDENNRKTGIQIASDLKKYGGEIIISNFGNAEVMGGRGFIRPIKFVSPIPIVSNIELGGSYLTDRESDPSISIIGLDAGLPIINTSFFSWQLYANYARIISYGSGTGYGTRVDFNLLMDILTLSAKFEKRNIGSRFIPSYFGPFYEVKRDTLIEILDNIEKVDGYFGGLYLTLLNKLCLYGTYQWTEQSGSGILNLTLDATKFIEQVPVTVTYTKMGITKSSELFDLSNKENVLWTITVSPGLFPHVYLILEANRQFMEVDNEYQPIDKYSVAIGYQF